MTRAKLQPAAPPRYYPGVPSLEELLTRFHDAGDAGAMEEIVARTRPRLAAAARRIGGQEADDSVQMAYHSLLRRGGEGFEAPVLAWLLTAVVRIAYRRKAVAARQTELADRLACPRPDSDPVAHAERAEECRLLRDEIAKLPHLYRDVIVLHHLEGLSVVEIARLVAAPPSTVKARLRRGRLLLRGRLDPRLRYGAMALPWWLADRARAIPASVAGAGAVMKGKLGVVVVVLLLLAAGGVTYGLRADGDRGTRRAADRGATEAVDRAPLAVDRPAGEKETPLPPPVDLDAVDLDRDLHGVIVDEAGAPVAGALVDVVRYPWRRTDTLNLDSRSLAVVDARTRSARDGTFRLGLRRGALVNLRVVADGFAPLTLARYQAGERARVVVRRGVELHVFVRDEAGNAVPNTRLRLFQRQGMTPLSIDARGVTDGDGRFTFTGLPHSTPLWLDPEHDVLGHPGWGWLEVDLPRTGAVEREVVLPAGRTLTGRVTDKESGEPIAGATVGMGWTMSEARTTDADGRYTLPGWMGNGTYEIVVRAKGYAEQEAKVGARETIDFALVAGGSVTGRLVSANGKPVANALLAAVASVFIKSEQHTSKGHARTGADGRFEIRDLRADFAHALTILARGYGRTMIEFVPGVDLGDIVLPRGVAIEGRVLESDGAPAARVRVVLRGSNDDRYARLPKTRGTRPGMDNDYGEEEERFTDHLGRFRFPDQSPGTYEIEVPRRGYPELERKIKLGAEPRLDVELRYPDGRPFAVLIVDDDETPLPEVVVNVTHGGGRVSARTGKDGRAKFFVSGAVTVVDDLWVLPGDQGAPRRYLMPAPVRDVPQGVDEVRVVLRKAATIEGRCVLPDGSGFERAILALEQDGKRVGSAYTRRDGGFVAEVAPGATVDLVFAGRRIPLANGGTTHDANAPFRGRRDGVAAGSRGVTVRVTPLPVDRTLTVTVLKPDGSPAAGLSVRLPGAPHDARAYAKADAAGRVGFEGLADRPDVVVVGVAAWMAAERLVPPAPYELTPAGQSIELRLREGRVRRGRVTVGGKGVPEGVVVARVGGYNVGFTKSAADGTFTIVVPKEGDATLLCEHAENIARRVGKRLVIAFTD